MLEINLNKPKSYTASPRDIKTQGITLKSKKSLSSQGDLALLINFLLLMLPGFGVYQYYKSMDTMQTSPKAQAMNKQLDELKEIETNLDSNIAKNKDLKLKFKDMNEKLTWINEIGQRRLKLLKSIEHFQKLTPDGLWVSSLSAGKSEILVNGYSLKEDNLSLFIEKLEEQTLFKDVILKRSVPADFLGRKLIQYNLQLKVEPS